MEDFEKTCQECGEQKIFYSYHFTLPNYERAYYPLCRNCFKQYFETKFYGWMEWYKIVEYNDEILVSLSGGKDSSVLLYLLHAWSQTKNKNLKITALHIQEGIPSYSEIMEKNVTRLCKDLNITFSIISFKEKFNYSLPEIEEKQDVRGGRPAFGACAICVTLHNKIIHDFAMKRGIRKVTYGINSSDLTRIALESLVNSNRLKPIKKSTLIQYPISCFFHHLLYLTTRK